tara:strand:- start:408418 stop:408945 length:528 start_codon:yes stop_codon:yes gene_type:complete
MKKIITFAGSNSKQSINKKLAKYAASQVKEVEVEVLDLNDYELPIFGVDHEAKFGVPTNAKDFLTKIQLADGVILSLAEHNGAYSTVFKNILDWMSRVDGKMWNGVPMLLMATSPGGRGGSSVLEIAKKRFPFMGGNIVASFSLPLFNDNFKDGIVDNTLNDQLVKEIQIFEKTL